MITNYNKVLQPCQKLIVFSRIFQKHIETPLALIQSGMDPSESLHPFSVSVTKIPHRTKGSKS